MTIPFSTHINGKPTFFVEKINKSIEENEMTDFDVKWMMKLIKMSEVSKTTETPAIANVPFIEEVMPNGYDKFKAEYFVADFCGRIEEFKIGLPNNYGIVKSGIVKEGDLIWCFIDGWEVQPVSKDRPDEYRHYEDSPVGFWKCVARHIA